MTGAPLPEGSDAVIMIEHVETVADHVRLLPPRTIKAGDNLVLCGAQAQAGQTLLRAGTRITFAQIALAAECGQPALPVFVRPRVAILATGDELVPVAAAPGPGQIRNSNAPMLASLVAAAGGEPWILPTASDDAASLDAAIALALQADLLLISGGVSAGKFDLVEPALARAGAQFHFTGIRIQPGKPLVFGELPRTSQSPTHASAAPPSLPFFGLPGNPVSSAVTFLLFASPLLAALAGNLEYGPRYALAQLAGPAPQGNSDLTRFLPAACTFSTTAGQLPAVTLVPWQGSGDLAALARSNCFLVVPPAEPDAAPAPITGNIVRILLP
jgi:molybdopterin molybdotransferase